MTPRAALIGYGSHGQDIRDLWEHVGRGRLEIFDDDPSVSELPPIPWDREYGFYIGENYHRREIAERVGGPGAPPLHEPWMWNPRDCVFAPGVVIAPGVTIVHSVTLGIHTHINTGTSLVRVWCGDFVTLAPGVVCSGDVEIQDDAFVGAGAVISDRVTIGKRAVIGAGAVVPPATHVPDDEVWVGVPARAVA